MLYYKMLKNNTYLKINQSMINIRMCKYCEYCGKPLMSIGNQRKNGKSFYNGSNSSNDWSSRKYHKTCYKAISESRSFIYMYSTDDQLKAELKKHDERLNRLKEKHEKERHDKYLNDFKVGDNIKYKLKQKHINFKDGVVIKVNKKSCKIKTADDEEINVKVELMKKC